MNCMRYLHIYDTLEIARMSFNEYLMRMKVYQLQLLDKRELMYEQAWINYNVQATKMQGKKEVPVYRTFNEFFNKKEFENRILGIKENKRVFVNK